MNKDFDYKKALERLEQIARTVEDPKTGLDDIDKYLKESEGLLKGCREYLRTAREKVEGFE